MGGVRIGWHQSMDDNSDDGTFVFNAIARDFILDNFDASRLPKPKDNDGADGTDSTDGTDMPISCETGDSEWDDDNDQPYFLLNG